MSNLNLPVELPTQSDSVMGYSTQGAYEDDGFTLGPKEVVVAASPSSGSVLVTEDGIREEARKKLRGVEFPPSTLPPSPTPVNEYTTGNVGKNNTEAAVGSVTTESNTSFRSSVIRCKFISTTDVVFLCIPRDEKQVMPLCSILNLYFYRCRL